MSDTHSATCLTMLKGPCDCGLAYRQKLDEAEQRLLKRLGEFKTEAEARLNKSLDAMEEMGYLIGMGSPEAVERQRQLLRVCATETAKVLASVRE